MISQEVGYGSELHKRIVNNVRERVRNALNAHGKRTTLWERSENLMMAAVPETDVDAKARKEREAGTPRYTTIQIPYTYAAVMAAYSYLSTVFLARTPVHQFGGRHGESEQQQQALEALIAYQTQVGCHLPAYYTSFYDAPKYGEFVLAVYWNIEKRIVSEIIEKAPTFLGVPLEGAKPQKVKRTKEVVGYSGNVVKNISPTRFVTDPRVARRDFQNGEFCFVVGEISWNDLIVGKARGQYINLDQVDRKRRGGVLGESNSERAFDNSMLERPDPHAFGSSSIVTASDMIKYYEMNIVIIPKDWKLGSSEMPEKWVFTVTQDYEVCFEARPSGYLHGRFPYVLGQVEPEGYGSTSRNFIEILKPVQETIDWLLNSHFYNVRATLNNKIVYDPSRVNTRDLERDEPGGAIRLLPSAYGSDPRTVVSQLQIGDVTQNNMNDIGAMYQVGERLGFNDQILGMGAPSSRRSATEFRSTATFSVGRLKTTAEYLSATAWTELATQLVSNSQQFYDQQMKVRIVGDLAMAAGQKFMLVTPDDISGFYDPVPIDGTLPADRYAQGNLWRELMAQSAQIPDVAMQYDMGKIFAWVAQLMGIKNITQFARTNMMQAQLVPDDVVAQNIQSGNAVGLTSGQVGEPGQISGMGPTG